MFIYCFQLFQFESRMDLFRVLKKFRLVRISLVGDRIIFLIGSSIVGLVCLTTTDSLVCLTVCARSGLTNYY
jgi:hypothetical protein